MCSSTSFVFLFGNISGVMVLVLASNAVDRGWGRTKNYQFGICCFSTKHTALRSKNKDEFHRHTVSHSWNVILWKENLKWWSTIPPISTKLTITSHLHSLNTKKRLTLEIRVMAWDMVQKCGGIDRVNGIPTPLLITGSPMAKHI